MTKLNYFWWLALAIALVMALAYSAHAQALPENPHARVIDKPFVMLHGISLGAALADASLTHTTNGYANHCYERDPLLGRYPSSARTYGVILGAWGVTTLASAIVKRSGKRWWPAIPITHASVNLTGIAQTMSACR